MFGWGKKTITLAPEHSSEGDGYVGRSWRVRGAGKSKLIFHSVPEALSDFLIPEDCGDHILVLALLHGMRNKAKIRVEGQVSSTLLAGLDLLQDIWAGWRPGVYHKVDLQAAREREMPTSPIDRTLVAFSGGVDAAYSLFKALQAAPDPSKIAAIQVQGFDIPLDQDQAYAGAREKALAMLASTSASLIALRTNSRSLKLDWEDSFGLHVCACFLLLQRGARRGIIGSPGRKLDQFIYPLGSTHLTDHLASTAAMDIVHDGSERDRSEKIAWLAEHSNVGPHLRVCWQGIQKDRNCGVCEKCLRTKLNFWSVGLPHPPSLPGPLIREDVLALIVDNQRKLVDMENILHHGKNRYQPSDPILRAVAEVVERGRQLLKELGALPI